MSSNLQEQVNPYDYSKEYGPSAFDIRHNFVASDNYDLPLEKLARRKRALTSGWAISGIARIATVSP